MEWIFKQDKGSIKNQFQESCIMIFWFYAFFSKISSLRPWLKGLNFFLNLFDLEETFGKKNEDFVWSYSVNTVCELLRKRKWPLRPFQFVCSDPERVGRRTDYKFVTKSRSTVPLYTYWWGGILFDFVVGFAKKILVTQIIP